MHHSDTKAAQGLGLGLGSGLRVGLPSVRVTLPLTLIEGSRKTVISFGLKNGLLDARAELRAGGAMWDVMCM